MRAAVAALAFCLIGCEPQPTTSVNQHEQAEKQADTGLTMAKYQQIREGMTYREAVEILGAEGTELSSSDVAGHRTVMYMWEGSGGANMNAMFQNGRLIQKAQFGLR